VILLRYLEDPEDESIVHLPSPWNRGWRRSLAYISNEVVRGMHAQIAAEQVVAFRRAKVELIPARGLDRVLASIPLGWNTTQIDHWLLFQLRRVDPRRGDHWPVARAIIECGRVPSAPLWRQVAKDVVGTLRPRMCGLAITP
jgi:hypothetical protein